MKSLLLAIAIVLGLAVEVAAQTSSHKFVLNWGRPTSANEKGYFVYRDGVKIGETKLGTTTFEDTVTGAWKQQFSYQVSAWNFQNLDDTGNVQESAKSTPAVGTIPVPTQPAPSAPSGLTITSVTTSQIQLRWQDNASASTPGGNETSQEIQVSTSSPPRTWTVPVMADATSHRLTNLKKNTQHRLKLRAVGDTGVSEYSNEVVATTRR